MTLFGIIFDLDGTLIDSRLDFSGMRAAIDVPEGLGILEFIESMADPMERKIAIEKIEQFERKGVERSALISGVGEALDYVDHCQLKRAIFTRNARSLALASLNKFQLKFEIIVAREDAPPKPDPAGVHKIIEFWRTEPSRVLVVGDYRFDLEAGRAAGTHTALFDPTHAQEFNHLAEFVFHDFKEFPKIVDKLRKQNTNNVLEK